MVIDLGIAVHDDGGDPNILRLRHQIDRAGRHFRLRFFWRPRVAVEHVLTSKLFIELTDSRARVPGLIFHGFRPEKLSTLSGYFS